MAYEETAVPVSKSQESIRRLIMKHGGIGLAVVSERDPEGKAPSREGFQARVMIDSKPYTVKVMTNLRKVKEEKLEQEERRVWRVLFYHLKSVFEAADSGVMEFRELMLPYIVTSDGLTISELILPRLDEAISGRTDRLLTT